MRVEVRDAEEADLSRLVELCNAAIDELRGSRGGGIWARREARSAPIAEDLRRALEDPGQHVLAGCLDEALLGYAVLRLERLNDGALLGNLSDIYVEPEAREVGLGEALFEAVCELAAGAGCVGIDALALPGDRETKNFFESHGMVARAIIVHRPLE